MRTWLRTTFLGLTLFSFTACERLNPDWCEDKSPCSAAEYCDPVSNTCRAREAGGPLPDTGDTADAQGDLEQPK